MVLFALVFVFIRKISRTSFCCKGTLITFAVSRNVLRRVSLVSVAESGTFLISKQVDLALRSKLSILSSRDLVYCMSPWRVTSSCSNLFCNVSHFSAMNSIVERMSSTVEYSLSYCLSCSVLNVENICRISVINVFSISSSPSRRRRLAPFKFGSDRLGSEPQLNKCRFTGSLKSLLIDKDRVGIRCNACVVKGAVTLSAIVCGEGAGSDSPAVGTAGGAGVGAGGVGGGEWFIGIVRLVWCTRNTAKARRKRAL